MIIFPCDPLNYKDIDPDFKNEFETAKLIGLSIIFFDFDLFNKTNELKITNKFILDEDKDKNSVLRSWMFLPEKYEKLYRIFYSMNIYLINTPSQYKSAHYFPYIYPYIKDYTPETRWIHQKELYVDKPIILGLLKRKIKNIGNHFIIKDFAKSNKIGNKIEKYKHTIKLDILYKEIELFIKDRKLYGTFYEGIVFKEFIKLKKYNGKANEWRLFILDGNIITYNLNSNVNIKLVNKPDIDFYKPICKKIPINFFTLDIAEKENGEWIIIEAGDGQVSGLALKQSSINLINNLKNNL